MSNDVDNIYRVEMESNSPEETQGIGKIIGKYAKPGDIYLLVAGLGSGKTTLTQGVLWGLGVDEFARSPTFVLVTEYEGRLPMYHMDLYRLDNINDIADLGMDEYFDKGGITVIEWAEKAEGLLPESSLTVSIKVLDETRRRLVFEYSDERYKDAIAAVVLANQ